jgi:hypothetical protein
MKENAAFLSKRETWIFLSFWHLDSPHLEKRKVDYVAPTLLQAMPLKSKDYK